MAWIKFNDAELLFSEKRFDSAFYLGGYTIELLLKALICKAVGIESFYDFEGSVQKPLSKEAYRPFKVHDFWQLFALSGIYAKFQAELQNETFSAHWAIVDKWSENDRYLTGKTETNVREFLISIKVVSEWIQRHL